MRNEVLENYTELLLQTHPLRYLIRLLSILTSITCMVLLNTGLSWHWLAILVIGYFSWAISDVLLTRIVVKVFRVDKQLDWLLHHPDGIAHAKKAGIAPDQIEMMHDAYNGVASSTTKDNDS